MAITRDIAGRESWTTLEAAAVANVCRETERRRCASCEVVT